MKPAPDPFTPPNFLAGGGEMGRRIREFDWSAHPLGAPAEWPRSLKIVIRILLTSRYAMWMGWGPELHFFCNDAYAPTLGLKRDRALGLPARLVWAEIWDDVGPRAESVVRTGEATWDESLLLFLKRSGYAEETYHTFSYSPIPDDDGAIGGMLCVVTEETERMIGARRLALLRELGADLASINTEHKLFQAVETQFRAHSEDLPFALIYLLCGEETCAQLASAHGVHAGSSLAPPEISLGRDAQAWPATELFQQGGAVTVENLANRFTDLPPGPRALPPRRAVLVPIARQGQERPAGFLVAGLNPHRPYDAGYAGFLDLLAGQIAAGLASARAYEAERKRAEALAEIDRAKTVFFSNVSHEFRTPLTLLLGPLEEIVSKPEGEVFPENRALAEVAHRNGLRLLKLVNALLDFSRIEAGRTRAFFEPVDLAACTAELASTFRSAMEKAGLEFAVECSPLPEPVHLDRGMWEKIVLNLLSNAFKFTLEGEVRLTVRALDTHAELAVRDTGAGIPPEALPRLFERFYRVPGAPGRSMEGSGIGLALVHELVKLHGGGVRVESEPGRGSTFIVTLPLGTAHLPAEQRASAAAPPAPGEGARAFLAEALRWLPDPEDLEPFSPAPVPPTASHPRILLADDNADMREYVVRLLTPGFSVTAVANGRDALDAALDERPDLVLSDVMMPGLDGFALLREMRADAALSTVPVILLSARAGEEARIEGLEAGADDYVIKPFNARELLAKVNSTLTLARVRAEALAREADLRAERTEILESMNLAFLALDPEFRFCYLNAEAGRLLGVAPQEYLGRAHWEVFPETVGTALEAHYRRAMAERVPVRFENFYTAWEQWFEINAYPMSGGRLGIFFRDITGQKRAQEALRESEERFRALADHITQLAWITDETGWIVWYNQRWFDYTGTTLAEMEGWGWQSVHHPEHLERVVEKFRRSLESGEAWEDTFPLRSHAGEFRWFLSRAMPIRDAEGKIVRWFGTNTDITELREVEAALREAKESAEAANASKDRFLAVLSHELRTPLTPVLMAVSALGQDAGLRPEVREDLAMMKRNIELETKLIDDLLDLSRITTGKLELKIEAVDLNAAVLHVGEICDSQLLEKKVRLEMELAGGDALIAADAARLRQVFWNVLKNAIKFTPESGAIRVTTTRLPGSRWEVRVQDSGAGIAPEAMPLIFDAFEQGGVGVTKQFGGLGLGLAISKALVELHRGTIRAESAGTGHGATFLIELPGEAPAAIPESTAAPVESAGTAQLRLLVVEDHADTARLLSRILRREGFAVSVAGDVASALAAAEREAFDVLVSDVGLPDGDGCELMRRLRAHRPVEGIAMSGFGMEDDVRRSREAGFSEHLVKPIEIPQLIAAIRRMAAIPPAKSV